MFHLKEKNFFYYLIELIFPRFCVGCGKIGTYLCYRCYETIEFTIFPSTKEIKSLESLTTCCKYSGVIKKIIFEFKYKNIRNLAKLITALTTYTTFLPKCTYYTYVPMHWKKKNIRGYNQSQLIAKHLACHANAKNITLLNKKNHTQSQKSTRSKKERIKNISDSFEYLQKSEYDKSQHILIVDDVLTTGSTLQACTNLLHENGWKHVHGYCFAQRN